MTFIENVSAFIRKEEGRSLKAYLDPNNDANRTGTGEFASPKGQRYAIGYGHNFGQAGSGDLRAGKITLGGGVSDIILRGANGKDTTITDQQAVKLLEKDIPNYINSAKNEWQKTFNTTPSWDSLGDNQKIALISYTYNAGPGGLQQLISRSDFKNVMAANNLTEAGRIIRDYGVRTAQGGNGVPVPALVKRRLNEGAIFANTTPSSFGFGIGGVEIFTTNTQVSDYIRTTYIEPMKIGISGKESQFFKYLNDELTDKLTLVTQTEEASSESRTFKQYLQSDGLFSESQLNGEIKLINMASEAQVKLQAEQTALKAKVDDIPSAAAAFLVQNNLFELSPDLMRQRMAANAGDSSSSAAENYSHAWRSPGKLAITADLTIPGASGFRIGQIFRVGRTYDHYNKYGAFQLFGLTEEISLGRGWTTTIHSRFNAMPTGKIAGVKSY